jgi:hypothetical protein
MKTTKLNGDPRCPQCNAKLDGVSSMFGDHAPSPGDPTVCGYCAALLQFTPELAYAMLDVGTLDANTQRELNQARAIVIQMRAQRN